MFMPEIQQIIVMSGLRSYRYIAFKEPTRAGAAVYLMMGPDRRPYDDEEPDPPVADESGGGGGGG